MIPEISIFIYNSRIYLSKMSIKMIQRKLRLPAEVLPFTKYISKMFAVRKIITKGDRP